MYTQLALDLSNLAIDQPTAVQPPGGEKILKIVGIILWGLVIGAVVGVMIGGGVMWMDHSSGHGATGGKGIKIVGGALVGVAVISSAAALVTFVL
ncbi:hypothetical protein MTX37_29190 [Rhodococcus sp. ARC_M8]|uniref:hypothetical protein n=1 Tax=Rhodococcus sp. ARC_M8 TaxID=2928853 RepID=UPI001FB41894|nr:hypothetical protein [Rhodococcus sp. ARC_M8]MCJ0950002.1 hypothetical protein [Rhodococcus sp. ARC_M8]